MQLPVYKPIYSGLSSSAPTYEFAPAPATSTRDAYAPSRPSSSPAPPTHVSLASLPTPRALARVPPPQCITFSIARYALAHLLHSHLAYPVDTFDQFAPVSMLIMLSTLDQVTATLINAEIASIYILFIGFAPLLPYITIPAFVRTPFMPPPHVYIPPSLSPLVTTRLPNPLLMRLLLFQRDQSFRTLIQLSVGFLRRSMLHHIR